MKPVPRDPTQEMATYDISARGFKQIQKVTSNPAQLDLSLLKERLIRNFLFKTKYDPSMLTEKSMHLYKSVFKLDDSFLAQVGPEKIAFDKRYMRKPPAVNDEKPKKKESKSELRKTMDDAIIEDKDYLKSMFVKFHADDFTDKAILPQNASKASKYEHKLRQARFLSILKEYLKSHFPDSTLKDLLPPQGIADQIKVTEQEETPEKKPKRHKRHHSDQTVLVMPEVTRAPSDATIGRQPVHGIIVAGPDAQQFQTLHHASFDFRRQSAQSSDADFIKRVSLSTHNPVVYMQNAKKVNRRLRASL